MSEDMTYEPVQTVAQLAARVRELEAQVAQMRMLNERIAHDELSVQMANDSLRTAIAELERENAELRARLVMRDELADAIRAIYNDIPVTNWTLKPLKVIRQWLASVGKQVSL